ncbi:MAG TPA: inorganic diphosphatase [Bryobacteraceae bacterium]|nr:inorganic diphosphatase [Bryobacteraceae bacterium]
MPNLSDMDPGPECPEIVRMIVEIPMHSSNKYEYDVNLGIFRLDRALYSPMHYPGDYGFIPGTLAQDGDPLDVLTLVSQPSFTGCMIEVRPLGLIDMIDGSMRDYKVFAVPKCDPRYAQMHSIDHVGPHVRREVEHFFTIYKELEGKETEIEGWRGPAEVRKLITECRQAYYKAHAK